MPDRHWENLKEIFHVATALPLNERDAYLDKACEGDQALRTAVAALLKSHEETGNFVDTPAHHAAAEMLADGVTLKAAQMITHLPHSFFVRRRRYGQGLFGRRYEAPSPSSDQVPSR